MSNSLLQFTSCQNRNLHPRFWLLVIGMCATSIAISEIHTRSELVLIICVIEIWCYGSFAAHYEVVLYDVPTKRGRSLRTSGLGAELVVLPRHHPLFFALQTLRRCSPFSWTVISNGVG